MLSTTLEKEKDQLDLGALLNGDPKVVSVDIDDTLTPFNDLAKKVIWDRHCKTGRKIYKSFVYASINHWRSPVAPLGIEEWLDVVAECHSNENILSNQPLAGSVEAINMLAEYNDIYYVSNRAPSTYVATVEWLTKCGYPSPNRCICLNDQPKIEFFKREGVDYIIDDRPKTLTDFVYSAPNKKAFGLLTEYNASLTDIDNIYLAHDWYGLAYYFEKEVYGEQ